MSRLLINRTLLYAGLSCIPRVSLLHFTAQNRGRLQAGFGYGVADDIKAFSQDVFGDD
jgi:hypothetical protein